jgi:hypothetical protein
MQIDLSECSTPLPLPRTLGLRSSTTTKGRLIYANINICRMSDQIQVALKTALFLRTWTHNLGADFVVGVLCRSRVSITGTRSNVTTEIGVNALRVTGQTTWFLGHTMKGFRSLDARAVEALSTRLLVSEPCHKVNMTAGA